MYFPTEEDTKWNENLVDISDGERDKLIKMLDSTVLLEHVVVTGRCTLRRLCDLLPPIYCV